VKGDLESLPLQEVPRLAIDAGAPLGWRPHVGPGIAVMGVGHFGGSAAGSEVMNKYSSSIENVIWQALADVKRRKKA
jgi:transketolase